MKTQNKNKIKTQKEIKMENNLKNLTEEQLIIAFNLLFKIKTNMVWDSNENIYCINENFVISMNDHTYNELFEIIHKIANITTSTNK